MKHKVYTIFDKVSEESSAPFMAKNDGVAIRIFESHELSIKDFTLFLLGTYDNETMLYDTFTEPHQVEFLDSHYDIKI